MIADLPTAGRFEGRVHLLPVRVYYEDTDFTGVVYHANYLRFFERGRSDFLRSAGTDHAALLDQADPIAFAVTRMEIDFRRAARIDDALVVSTAFDTVKGPRMLVSQQIRRGDEVVCAAEVTVAVIDLQGRPKRPPRALVEGLAPWLKPLATQGDAP